MGSSALATILDTRLRLARVAPRQRAARRRRRTQTAQWLRESCSARRTGLAATTRPWVAHKDDARSLANSPGHDEPQKIVPSARRLVLVDRAGGIDLLGAHLGAIAHGGAAPHTFFGVH